MVWVRGKILIFIRANPPLLVPKRNKSNEVVILYLNHVQELDSGVRNPEFKSWLGHLLDG